MATKSDYGEQKLVTNSDGVTFDLNKDYSAAISAAKAAGQDTTQLEAERAAKINSSAYGGTQKTGSQSSSVGTTYNANATVANRTSTTAPITTTQSSATPVTQTPAATNTSTTMSDYGPQILVTSANGVTYDLNKDYAAAIAAAKAAGQDTTQLELQRQAKINSAAYGGAYKEGNVSASLGTVYDENATVANRTSNSDPISVIQKPQEQEQQEANQSTAAPATPNFSDYLDRWYAAAQEQQKNQIDYATSTGVNELVRAQQDAQEQFQTQRNQIAIDEANAKDNQALYAEARGDNGGIGAAQYDSIMNTAAQNRLAVNSAQTKLATDTSRQIADLRAQGEFEKADALLTLSQQYLSQLISLEQWAAEYGLNVAQFNASLQQWQAEFELAVGETLGNYKGQQTLGAQQFAFSQQQYSDELAMTQKNQLSDDGWLFLQAGIMPSASQLNAMGMTADQAKTILTSQQLAASSKGSGGSSKSSTNTSSGTGIDALFYDAMRYGGDAPWTWIKENRKKYGVNNVPEKSEWEAYQKKASNLNSEGGMNESHFNATAKTIEQWFAQGLNDNAVEYIDRVWDQLNVSQKLTMEKIFKNYGYER